MAVDLRSERGEEKGEGTRRRWVAFITQPEQAFRSRRGRYQFVPSAVDRGVPSLHGRGLPQEAPADARGGLHERGTAVYQTRGGSGERADAGPVIGRGGRSEGGSEASRQRGSEGGEQRRRGDQAPQENPDRTAMCSAALQTGLPQHGDDPARSLKQRTHTRTQVRGGRLVERPGLQVATASSAPRVACPRRGSTRERHAQQSFLTLLASPTGLVAPLDHEMVARGAPVTQGQLTEARLPAP